MAKSQRELDDERKANEYRDLMQLSEFSPLIKIKALDVKGGAPPTKYEIVYTCRGYSHAQRPAERFVVKMTLSADYPRALPLFQYDPSTPIFHPHVFPSFSGVSNYICIGHDNQMAIGLPLREYVLGVGEMIQWRKGTNGKQAVDNRSLVGSEPTMAISAPVAPLPAPPIAPMPRDAEIVISIAAEDQAQNAAVPIQITLLDEAPAQEEVLIRIVDDGDRTLRGGDDDQEFVIRLLD